MQAFNAEVEDIKEKDFLLLADQAFQQGDLNHAARMYYMHTLRVLDEREAIVWTPRKTNQDYLAECRLTEVIPRFARLTYLFDYAWYGDFPVDRRVVEEMRRLVVAVEATNGGRS